MDFSITEAQKEFRREVEAWLDANLPDPDSLPAELYELDAETEKQARKFRTALVAKHWLRPTYPKEYGGGEMSFEELEVFAAAMAGRPIPELYDASYLAGSALMSFGTEEQKERWLPLVGRGEIVSWQCYTEPEAGTDLAGVKTTAIPQPDGGYLMNGQKIYSGNGLPVDYLVTLAVSDPEAVRHRNLSLFLVKAGTPGITMDFLDPICMHRKRVVYFDNVSVPAESLLGPLHQGWNVAQASLAGERGRAYSLGPYRFLDEFIDYCKTTKRGGKRLADDPAARDLLVDLIVEARAGRLLYWRTFWKGGHGIPTRYEGFQNNLAYKEFLPKMALAMLRILGPAAVITDPKWAVLKDRAEYFQRLALMTHGGGTPEALKVSFARAIGLPGTRREKK